MGANIGAGLIIFILDDEEDICLFSKRFFEKRGFKVQTSMTIKDALSRINKNKFDVALLDQHLEGGSGMDVLKAIREKQPECQCIMLTVEDDKTIVVNAKKMGAVDYLFKPLKIEDIDKAISRVVKKIKKETK